MANLSPTTVTVNGDGSVTVDADVDTGVYLNVRISSADSTGVYAVGPDILPATVSPHSLTPPLTAEVWGLRKNKWQALSAPSEPFSL
jgi:hypothetical protein